MTANYLDAALNVA